MRKTNIILDIIIEYLAQSKSKDDYAAYLFAIDGYNAGQDNRQR